MIWYGNHKAYYGQTSDNRIVRVTDDCMKAWALDEDIEENTGKLEDKPNKGAFWDYRSEVL